MIADELSSTVTTLQGVVAPLFSVRSNVGSAAKAVLRDTESTSQRTRERVPSTTLRALNNPNAWQVISSPRSINVALSSGDLSPEFEWQRLRYTRHCLPVHKSEAGRRVIA